MLAHGGSVYWNDYRGRWVMIAVESFGSPSFLGEVWYAEADTPLGPWVYARKIVTHDKYSFYNPKQHPMFDQQGGRIIYFEGTYTTTFSGNTDPTPRYDYNQVMYRLDLSDRRLALPVAVYEVPAGAGAMRLATRAGRPRGPRGAAPPRGFLRPRSARAWPACRFTRRPIRPADGPCGSGPARHRPTATRSAPLFYLQPEDPKVPPGITVRLYEHQEETGGRRSYSVDSPVRRNRRDPQGTGPGPSLAEPGDFITMVIRLG